jgi:anti-sigma-K factor RskA
MMMDGEQDDMTGPSGDAYELDELLGAYALDAVDDVERRRVEDYLEVNPRAAAEVQAHRETATMLAFTGMDAPDDLWGRIADEIGEQAPPPGPELAKVLSMDDAPSRRRISAIAPWVVTAAAAAVIGFVAIGLADSAEAPNDPMSSAVELALADRDSLTTTLVSDTSDASADAVIDQDGHGFVLGSDLPSLPDDQTYQLWGVVESGEVISLGIFGPNPEVETFTVDGSVTALAITIEEYPGVISNGNPDGAFVGAF